MKTLLCFFAVLLVIFNAMVVSAVPSCLSGAESSCSVNVTEDCRGGKCVFEKEKRDLYACIPTGSPCFIDGIRNCCEGQCTIKGYCVARRKRSLRRPHFFEE